MWGRGGGGGVDDFEEGLWIVGRVGELKGVMDAWGGADPILKIRALERGWSRLAARRGWVSRFGVMVGG